MRTYLILVLTIILTSCGLISNKSEAQNTEATSNQRSIYMAEKIKIDGLQNALTKLKNGQTEFSQFIGITSNGVDCIYFMYENGRFNLDFEAMSENQITYIDKLKDFAQSNRFQSVMTTYNNKPHYKSDRPAPVIHIETNASLEEMAKLGERIQREIFKNNKETVYEVVP